MSLQTHMNKKRFDNLSIYRFIATICVLQFHIFFILYARDIPYETLLSKGVQGLTALSGFLYSQKLIKDLKGFYLGNLKKIVIPAVVCFLFMALWNLIAMFIIKDYNYIGLFFGHRAFNNSLLFQPANYYYLAYILIAYLITPVLQRMDKYAYSTAILAIILEIVIGFFFGPSIILSAYIVGYLIGKKAFAKYVDIETPYSVPRLLFWIFVTALTVGLYIVMVEFPMGEGYFRVHLSSATKNILQSSFGVATFFLAAYIFRWVNRYKSWSFLSYFDKLTLIIYLMNQAFMVGAMNVTLWVSDMWLKITLVYIFTIGSSVLLKLANDGVNKLFTRPNKVQEA